jgi:antitoxin YefM
MKRKTIGRLEMIALNTVNTRDDFLKVSELVTMGEIVLITRPHDENIVVLSEKEYRELEKARSNEAYLAKIDSAIERVASGRVVFKTMDELEEMAN